MADAPSIHDSTIIETAENLRSFSPLLSTLSRRRVPFLQSTVSPLHIRLLFAYIGVMWNLPESRFCDFTVRCKGCGENVPAPVQTMPDTWIVADCPLCGERRAYLPPDIFRGRISYRLSRKPARSEARVR